MRQRILGIALAMVFLTAAPSSPAAAETATAETSPTKQEASAPAPEGVAPLSTFSAGVVQLAPAYGAARLMAQMRGSLGVRFARLWTVELDLAFSQSLEGDQDATSFGGGPAVRFVWSPDGIGPTALVGLDLSALALDVPVRGSTSEKTAREGNVLGPRAQLGLRLGTAGSLLALEVGIEGAYWRWLSRSSSGLSGGFYLTIGAAGSG